MAFKKNYMKMKKKAFGAKGVRGRYDPTRAGAKSLLNMYKDIQMVKARLNVEKKLIDRDVVTGSVGNVNNNAEGSMKLDVTPIISQGVGEANRVGNSLKLTGMSFPMALTQQSKTLGDRLVRISLYKVTSADDGVTAGETYNQLYDINPLTGIKDFNASKAYRSAKTDGITLVRSQTVKIASTNSQNSDSSLGNTELQVRNVRFSVKLQDLLRYDSNAQTLPSGTRYFLILQCNAGNVHPSAVSTRDVAVTAANTGITARIAQRIWYVDN